jgi:hypothetical protein
MYCSKPDCTRKVHARGICTTHYQARLRANKDKVCSQAYCTRGASAFGLCGPHYKQEAHFVKTNENEIEKYWQWIKKELRLV